MSKIELKAASKPVAQGEIFWLGWTTIKAQSMLPLDGGGYVFYGAPDRIFSLMQERKEI